MAELGFRSNEDALGKHLKYWGGQPVIIGVLRDFHFRSLHQTINPLVVKVDDDFGNGYLSIRIKTNDIPGTLESVRKTWQAYSSGQPFVYTFLNDDLERLYRSEQQWSLIITIASGVAIFIACLGVLGLVMYTVEQRKREIGIRKALGARGFSIYGLLSKDLVWLVLIANFIAGPFGMDLSDGLAGQFCVPHTYFARIFSDCRCDFTCFHTAFD